MNENDIYDYLISRGAILGKPFHNGEKEWQLEATIFQTGFEVLWEYGYKSLTQNYLPDFLSSGDISCLSPD